MTYALIVSMPVLLFGGMFYELLGRKKTISIMFIVGAISSLFIPYGINLSHKISYFTFFKVVYTCSMVPIIAKPFVNDYVVV